MPRKIFPSEVLEQAKTVLDAWCQTDDQLTFGTLVVTNFSWLRLGIWLVLFIDLVIKFNYEEGILAAWLEGYRDYMQRSYRLIPFIY